MNKRILTIGFLVCAPTLSAFGQGSSVFPYTTPLWRTFLDGTTAEFQADSDSTTFFQILDADGGTPIFNVDSTNERLGIGTASPTRTVHVLGTETAFTPTFNTFVNFAPTLSPAGAVGGGTFYNFQMNSLLSNQAISASGFGFHGVSNTFDVRSQFTGATYLRGFFDNALFSSTSSGTINHYRGFDSGGVQLLTGSTVTVSSMQHFNVRNSPAPAGGSITNQYGFYAGDLTSATNNWAVYTAGTTKSYFGGNVGIGEVDPATQFEMTGSDPRFRLHCNTHTDDNEARKSGIEFGGEQSGGEESLLAVMEASHDGTADDQKARIVLSRNDGDDGEAPTEVWRIDGTTSHICTTVIKTIDLDDDASTDDFQFDDDAADMAEQAVDLGAIIPAYAELLSVQLRCFETVTGSTAMSIDLGTASGGAEILTAANVDSANDINGPAAAAGPILAATNAARNVWINATPAANWNTLDAGRWAVMITYIDYAGAYAQKNP